MTKKLSYADRLRDPRWQKKRLEILQRDDFTCRKCRAKDKTLHVHHVAYYSGQDPWDYSDDFLLTLCYECHEDEGGGDYEKSLTAALSNVGFLQQDFFSFACLIGKKPEIFKQILDDLRKSGERF